MYHVKDGLFFEVQPTGDVIMVKREKADLSSKEIFKVVIPVGQWISIVKYTLKTIPKSKADFFIS